MVDTLPELIGDGVGARARGVGLFRESEGDLFLAEREVV